MKSVRAYYLKYARDWQLRKELKRERFVNGLLLVGAIVTVLFGLSINGCL
jgi:hypothetical protein